MSSNLNKIPPCSRYHSGELDDWKANLYFANDCPGGQPMIIRTCPHSTTLKQLFRDEERSKLGAMIASFAKSIFHRIKCKPKSTIIISQVPKPLKTIPPLYPKIPREGLRNYDSYKKGIDGSWLVHQAKCSQNTKTVFDEFVEYKDVLSIGANEALFSTKGRLAFKINRNLVEHDCGYCDQRQSV